MQLINVIISSKIIRNRGSEILWEMLSEVLSEVLSECPRAGIRARICHAALVSNEVNCQQNAHNQYDVVFVKTCKKYTSGMLSATLLEMKVGCALGCKTLA